MKTIGCAVVAVVSVIAGWWGYHRYFQISYAHGELPFSREAWATADAEHRGYMPDDILRRRVLDNLTREAVLALLGPTERATTVEEMHDRWMRSLNYTREQCDQHFGEFATGRLYCVYYDIGYLGDNPRAPFVFRFHLRVEFRDGRVLRVGGGD